jgi:hypothetical protein
VGRKSVKGSQASGDGGTMVQGEGVVGGVSHLSVVRHKFPIRVLCLHIFAHKNLHIFYDALEACKVLSWKGSLRTNYAKYTLERS